MEDPRDVIREFERIALDDGQELDLDDAIAGLAQIVADEPMPDEIKVALTIVGATLYRVRLRERMISAATRVAD